MNLWREAVKVARDGEAVRVELWRCRACNRLSQARARIDADDACGACGGPVFALRAVAVPDPSDVTL